jgi:hypothetical protein
MKRTTEEEDEARSKKRRKKKKKYLGFEKNTKFALFFSLTNEIRQSELDPSFLFRLFVPSSS